MAMQVLQKLTNIILLPLHTLDENKMLAPHVGITFEIPYKLEASMRVLPYQ